MQSLTQRAYTSLLRILAAGRGLAWQVDGVTTLRIDPRCRWIRHPSYEADVAAYLKAGIRPATAASTSARTSASTRCRWRCGRRRAEG